MVARVVEIVELELDGCPCCLMQPRYDGYRIALAVGRLVESTEHMRKAYKAKMLDEGDSEVARGVAGVCRGFFFASLPVR